MKNVKYYILLFVFPLFSSCTEFLKSIEETKSGKSSTEWKETKRESDDIVKEAETQIQNEESPKIIKDKEFAANPEDLQRVEDELRDLPQLKGKKIQVYQSIHFYDNYRVLMQIQNPDNPNYVDEYYYTNGSWQEPKPIVLSKHTKVDKDLVPLDEIPFIQANKVYTALKSKLEEIQGKTSDITVYVITRNSKVRWYPRTIANTRSKYAIEFNKDGSLLSFEQE